MVGGTQIRETGRLERTNGQQVEDDDGWISSCFQEERGWRLRMGRQTKQLSTGR